MKQSPYMPPLFELLRKVNDLEQKILLIIDTVDQFTTCQRDWIYFQPIFRNKEIKQTMPVEWKKFSIVDRAWRNLMNQIFKDDG